MDHRERNPAYFWALLISALPFGTFIWAVGIYALISWIN